MRRLNGRPVIVVDDDDDLRETIADLLRAEGLDVHPASNGREALPLLQQFRSANPVLLLDIVMPMLDGLSLIEHLRQHMRDLRVSVVVMTASNLRPPPGYSVLTKPFTTEDFLRAVLSSAPHVETPTATLRPVHGLPPTPAPK